MRFHLCWACLLCLFSTSDAAPRDKGAKAPPKPAQEGNAVEVRYHDGSVVKMKLLDDVIEVVTRYGSLNVTTAEIRRIEVGLRFPDGMVKRIEAAVADLSKDDFQTREGASAELLSLREYAYPAVQRLIKSADLETAQRAQTLLKTMRQKLPEAHLRIKGHDIVETIDFAIAGQIKPSALKARTAYFGDIDLKLAEVRAIRWQTTSRPETEVSVDAAKYGSQHEQWLATEFEANAEVSFAVTASGTVDLWPVQGGVGQWTAGPNGQANWGGGMPGRMQFSGGALLGKIGENGKPFLIGEKYSGKPSSEGKLFLRIAPSPWGNESSGEYKVKIRVGDGGSS
jgi:hypothetical protein